MVAGDMFKNGATLLAQKEERDSKIALAVQPKLVGGVASLEFVTWLMGNEDSTYEGHYYTNYRDAENDFRKRF